MAARLFSTIPLRSVLGLILLASHVVAFAFDAAPSRPVDLTGHWRLNEAASDDAERMLQERFEEEAKKFARRMKDRQRERAVSGPAGAAPPVDTYLAPPSRYTQQFRRLLGITRTLGIVQEGARIEIASDVETRRFEAGTRSQVSLHGEGLADSRVGWKRQWFVIERRVRDGVRVVERYRWLEETDQLESTLDIGGDHFLEGMEVKRIFDRMQGPPPRQDPTVGPVR